MIEPTILDVEEALRRISPFIHRTQLVTCASINAMVSHVHSGGVYFKCENFQKTGSFKIRGATNAVMRACEETPQLRGFVTHSSGNHGQALAKAARDAHRRAVIVVPRNASKLKIAAMEHYGGEIVYCEPTQTAREAACRQILAENSPYFALIHPYDDPRIIAGQGTLGIELLQQSQACPLDAVVVPVGGGGLLSGVATAIKGLFPSVAVFGAEPLNADDTSRSFMSGKLVASHRPGLPSTIADGLLTLNSTLTFGIIQKNVDGIIVVTEEQIKRAMAVMLERTKMVVEPSSAVGVAAVLYAGSAQLSQHKRIAVILCGGNVATESISELCKL